MTDANPFPQPGKVSMEYAVRHIVRGLANNDPHVAFPTFLYALSASLGALPSVVRDVLARFRLVPQIAYARASSRSARAPAAAASAAAAAAADTSAVPPPAAVAEGTRSRRGAAGSR